MSTAQVEGTVRTLDANAVQEVLAAGGTTRMATATSTITIFIYESFGRAFIMWQLPYNYSIGAQDVVQLREGTKFVENGPHIESWTGSWDTGRPWGTGLNASYWSWDYGQSPGWRQMVGTANT